MSDASPLASMTPSAVADILRRAGSQNADEELILADIEDGAPTDESGMLNLIEYFAWLAMRVSDG